MISSDENTKKTNSNTKRGAKIDILEWNAPGSSRDAITVSKSETEEDQRRREGTEALSTPTTANIALETSSQPFTYIIYWCFVASNIRAIHVLDRWIKSDACFRLNSNMPKWTCLGIRLYF